MKHLIDAVTDEALCHPEDCECVVCRAASGDNPALLQLQAAYERAWRANND